MGNTWMVLLQCLKPKNITLVSHYIKPKHFLENPVPLKSQKTILKTYWPLVSHYIKPKHFLENPVPFQTHRLIVASVPQIVLRYWIALFKPKSGFEAIKPSYYITVNPKFVWKFRGLDNYLEKLVLHLPLRLNKHVQEEQVPLTRKPQGKTIDP